MFVTVVTLIAVLSAGQQSQSMGAAEALRSPPPPPSATTSRDAASTPPAATPEAEPAPRMVCRSIPVTGSRFPIRQCRSTQQSEAERAESREALRRMQGSRTMPVG